MINATEPQTPQEAKAARKKAWSVAWEKARKEQLHVVENPDGTWTCKQYTIVITGPRVAEVACDCTAGHYGHPCKHAIMVIWCRKFNIRPETSSPARLQTKCPRCFGWREDPLHSAFCDA